MKLKAAVRYQAMELLASALVFCGVIAALMIVGWAIATTTGAYFSVSGVSALGLAFVGIFAMGSFESDLRFFLQNGLARAQALASCAISFLLAILLLTVADAACSAFLPGWAQQSLFFGWYGMGQSAVVGFFWTFLAYAAFTAIVFALAALRMRIGRKPFLAVLGAAVLVMLFVVPALCETLLGSAMPLLDFARIALGFTPVGVSPVNPIVLFAVLAALAALVAYLLTRRIEVR